MCTILFRWPTSAPCRLVSIGALIAALALSAAASAGSLWTPIGVPALLATDPGPGTEHVRVMLNSADVGSDHFVFAVQGQTLAAEHRHSERFKGGWNWSGTVDGDPTQTLEITWAGDRLAGRLQTARGLWEIRPLAAGESALVPVDATAFPAELPPLLPPGEPLPLSSKTIPAPPTAKPVRIDVLVTYLTGVVSEAGSVANLNASVRNFIYGANQAARTSGLHARYHLVGLLESPLPDMETFPELLYALTDDEWTSTQRDLLAADLVSLLLPNAGHTDFCGLAWVMGDHDSFTYEGHAYQTTKFSCAKTNYTWAHEHGHNLGFQHDAGNSGMPPYHPFAYGWGVSGVFRTIMAYAAACSPSCPRIGMFSTPRRSYSGYPAGAVDIADNVRAGNITAPIVAAYRSGNVLFADDFEG